MPEHSETLLPPPRPVAALIRLLEAITRAAGRTVAWLAPLMVLATCAVVVLRYGLDQGSVALQESVTYMHSALFLIGAGYALHYRRHVRVDVFYRRFSPEGQAWVDALGALVFVIPLAVFTAWISRDFVLGAWRIREASTDSGGLAWVYLLKSLIPLLALGLLLQGLAELLRQGLRLTGHAAPPHPDEREGEGTDAA